MARIFVRGGRNRRFFLIADYRDQDGHRHQAGLGSVTEAKGQRLHAIGGEKITDAEARELVQARRQPEALQEVEEVDCPEVGRSLPETVEEVLSLWEGTVFPQASALAGSERLEPDKRPEIIWALHKLDQINAEVYRLFKGE